jgi:hypothetical protein
LAENSQLLETGDRLMVIANREHREYSKEATTV